MGITAGAAAALQIGGALNSAVGARASASAQKQAMLAQTQLDQINARASASALDAQAGLDSINAQSTFEFTSAKADLALVGAKAGAAAAGAQTALDLLGAEGNADAIRTEAAINASRNQTAMVSMQAAAEMAEQSALLSELKAESALLFGQQEEQQTRLQTAQVKGKQTATMAARGLDLGEGAPLAVLTTTDLMGENSAIGIQQRALLSALGHRAQATGALVEAAGKRYQAAMLEVSTRLDTDLSGVRADSLVANARAAADARRALIDADLMVAEADTKATKILAGANLANAKAAADMKSGTAEILRINSAAGAAVRRAQADGINPTSALTSSLLSSAGQVAGSWYQYSKQSQNSKS